MELFLQYQITYIFLQNIISSTSTWHSLTFNFFSSPPFLFISTIFSHFLYKLFFLIFFICFFFFSLSIFFFFIFYVFQNLSFKWMNMNIRDYFCFYGKQVIEKTNWTLHNIGGKFSNLNLLPYLQFSHHYKNIQIVRIRFAFIHH